MIAVVASRKDPASLNIASSILSSLGEEPRDAVDLPGGTMVFVEEDTPFLSWRSLSRLSPDEVIVLSRHASASGMDCLTVHVPGNLTKEARLGGNPEEVAVANPSTMRALLVPLKEEGDRLGVPVSLEATHHGPTDLPVPVSFVEIGSTPQAWGRKEYGEAVARAVLRALADRRRVEHFVGIGGPHYAPKHTSFVLSREVGVGHIVPKYALGAISERVLRSLFERTVPPCRKAVLDRKGIPSPYRKRVVELLDSWGVEWLII